MLRLVVPVSPAVSSSKRYSHFSPKPTNAFPTRLPPHSHRPLVTPIKASLSPPTPPPQDHNKKSFWAAVTLIIGTAVGPGMLGLPAATIRSGPLPSSLAILLSWLYVISSVLLVADLTFASMHHHDDVTFTTLASTSLGPLFGSLVAVVFASLSFALIVACVSGIGSIVSQWAPSLSPLTANALFPAAIGLVIMFFPFSVIDSANRVLCCVMILSISALVGIGVSVSRGKLVASIGNATWRLDTILPAIPVTVLTLGFHVITPFVCKLAGDNVREARKAILVGGAVPLVMVLCWNFVVLGLAAPDAAAALSDPIALLLSVNPSALSAVRGFAFSALATSLIGYAVSFPKQLVDTVRLIVGNVEMRSRGSGFGRVGFAVYSGNEGRISFTTKSVAGASLEAQWGSNVNMFVVPIVLGVPVFIATFFNSIFARALDFAGVYANCVLFGILPPMMAYVHKSRNKIRSSVLPGGYGTLLILFGIAVILGIWH